MENDVLYHQCRFRRGSERTVAWIEARGAKLGAQVELTSLDNDGPWIVESVGKPGLANTALETLQRLNRKSLSDYVRNIV
jgi:hypothetical protein